MGVVNLVTKIYSCLNGSVYCGFIDWPVKNLLMRTKVAIDDVSESQNNEKRPV